MKVVIDSREAEEAAKENGWKEPRYSRFFTFLEVTIQETPACLPFVILLLILLTPFILLTEWIRRRLLK